MACIATTRRNKKHLQPWKRSIGTHRPAMSTTRRIYSPPVNLRHWDHQLQLINHSPLSRSTGLILIPHRGTTQILQPHPPQISSKDFPRISIDVQHRPSKYTSSNKPWPRSCSTQSSANADDGSDYSDDIYGSGRPLRPSLINSDDRIREWQLSAQGNPQVTAFLDPDFQPDCQEKIFISNKELSAFFLDNEFQLSDIMEFGQSSSPIDKNPSAIDDLAVLIQVDEPTAETGRLAN